MVVLLALLAGCASGGNIVVAARATPVDPTRVEGRDFWFEVGGRRVSAPRDGVLQVGAETVALPLDDGEFESLQFIPHGDGVLLFYDLTFGGEGAAGFAYVAFEPLYVVNAMELPGLNLQQVSVRGTRARIRTSLLDGWLEVGPPVTTSGGAR